MLVDHSYAGYKADLDKYDPCSAPLAPPAESLEEIRIKQILSLRRAVARSSEGNVVNHYQKVLEGFEREVASEGASCVCSSGSIQASASTRSFDSESLQDLFDNNSSEDDSSSGTDSDACQRGRSRTYPSGRYEASTRTSQGHRGGSYNRRARAQASGRHPCAGAAIPSVAEKSSQKLAIKGCYAGLVALTIALLLRFRWTHGNVRF